MNSRNILCCYPHCWKLLSNQPPESSPYGITKCGHIYHESCFEQVKRNKLCPKCQVVFNPKQSFKIKMEIADSEYNNSDSEIEKSNRFYQWMFYDDKTKANAEDFPDFAYPLGPNEVGLMVYVARVYHNDDILPAYICPDTKHVYSILENKIHFYKGDIDILDIHNDKGQAIYQWEACIDGTVPENAVVTGEIADDVKLYTIRSQHHDRMLFGHIDSNLVKAQVINPLEESFGHFIYDVLDVENYEVLVRKPLTMYAKLT